MENLSNIEVVLYVLLSGLVLGVALVGVKKIKHYRSLKHSHL